MPGRRLIIFANGVMPDVEAARALLRIGDGVLCADAGVRHARRLGLTPDLVVGDLDSLEADDREWIAARGIRVIEYPPDKDQTDLELAIHHGLLEDPVQIIVVGGLGARLDHTLGNIALLADKRLLRHACTLDDGVEQVMLCRDSTAISGAPGDLVSLLPWGQPATGVRTSALKWPLNGEVLLPEGSRGISNEMTAVSAQVSLETGLLLIVHRRRLHDDPAGL